MSTMMIFWVERYPRDKCPGLVMSLVWWRRRYDVADGHSSSVGDLTPIDYALAFAQSSSSVVVAFCTCRLLGAWPRPREKLWPTCPITVDVYASVSCICAISSRIRSVLRNIESAVGPIRVTVFLPTTLVVQVEQSVIAVSICLTVCLGDKFWTRWHLT